jgi:zinc protease
MNMKRILQYGFFAVVMLGFGLAIQAQNKAGNALPLDPKVKIGKLSNGLTYYIRENKKPEQKVELRLVINAGSVLEKDDQSGLAHFAEHMAFNGTKNFKKNDIISFLQGIGVGFGNDLNAYTGFDETVYILPIPTDKKGNLEKGFQILEDWAHSVTYLDADIDAERAVILEESRLGKGANNRMLNKVLPELLTNSMYAKRLPIGLDSNIQHFKYDRLKQFYRDWYRPNLMAVIVVGDVQVEQAEALVKKHFSALTNPNPAPERTYTTVNPYAKTSASVITDKEATSYQLAVNYPVRPTKPSESLDDYRQDMKQSLFTSLLNQRLQEQTQKENPPYIGAAAGFDSYARGYESFNVFAAAGTGDINRALGALVEEVERVKRYGFTADELERAKKNMLTNYERAYNNRTKTESSVYTEEYIRHFLEKEPMPGIENEFEYAKQLLPAITIEDVNQFASFLKQDQHTYSYVMGPEASAGNPLPTSAELLAVAERKKMGEVSKYAEKAVAAQLMSTKPVAGKVAQTTQDKYLNTTQLVLSNGVTVTLKNTDFKADQVLMSAVRYGGKNGFALNDKYNADYATALVTTMGVSEFSPTDLKKVMAGKSAQVTPLLTDATEGFKGNSSVKDMEAMFQMLYLYATAPRKDTALFRSFLQRNKSQVAMIGANPQAAFIDTLNQILYQNSPLAPTAIPKVANFDQINLDRSLEMYRGIFSDMGGMHFTFVGSFSMEQIIPLIETYIGSLPAKKKNPRYVDNKLRPISGEKRLTYYKGKDPKSLILAFYQGEMPYSEQMELKAGAISEILNIRIIEELREKIQGIYGGGIFGGMSKVPYENYSFVLQLPCGPEKVDTLLQAANAEIKQLVTKGPSDENLAKVKKQWIEQYKTQIKDNNYWLTNLQDIKLYGNDPKMLLDYEQKVNALTKKEIQDAAKQFFNGKSVFTAVLMPEKK